MILTFTNFFGYSNTCKKYLFTHMLFYIDYKIVYMENAINSFIHSFCIPRYYSLGMNTKIPNFEHSEH